MTALHAESRQPVGIVHLQDEHRPTLNSLVDADPYVNAVLASRLRTVATLDARHLGGALIGVHDWPTSRAAVFDGGALLLVGGDETDWMRLGTAVAQRRRRCTSIVGREDAVGVIWQVLRPVWGPARATRQRQPLLTHSGDLGQVSPDARVRPVRTGEIEQYLPAAIAMFTEELAVSPLAAVGRAAYRRRVAGLIRAGRAFGIFDRDGSVMFKADVGAVSERTCQVQGVWVRPDLRGRGIGTAALAAVFGHALRMSPTVSLYVNDYNIAACRTHERLGMRQAATMSTVLL